MTFRGSLFALIVLGLMPAWVSCKKPEKVVVTETRELTMYDDSGDSLVAVMPPEWRRVPGTQLRIFNYRFGDDGEVYVSRARGGVVPNANRWLGQFGKPPIMATGQDLPTVTVLGREGIIVDAVGDFAGGMGKPPREGAALIGVIVDFGGELVTIKMIGAAEKVAAERERLIKFCRDLRIDEASSSDQ